MKKIIIIGLNISLLILLGCYYQEQMSPSSYDFNDHSNIMILTKDTTYHLKGNDYQLNNDTLIVSLSEMIDANTKVKTKKGIPLKDIELIDVERTKVIATTLLVVGIAVIPIGLLIAGLLEKPAQQIPYHGPHGL